MKKIWLLWLALVIPSCPYIQILESVPPLLLGYTAY